MGTGHVPQLSHMWGARLPLGTPQGHLFPCLPFDRLCDAGSHCGLRDAPAGRHFFVVCFRYERFVMRSVMGIAAGMVGEANPYPARSGIQPRAVEVRPFERSAS